MRGEGIFLLFACVAVYSVCAFTTQRSDPTPSENFPFRFVLDKDRNYFLYWKLNATYITFETHVRTLGYVGFGLSSNGKMFPSDVVIGWVKDGVTYFKVCIMIYEYTVLQLYVFILMLIFL